MHTIYKSIKTEPLNCTIGTMTKYVFLKHSVFHYGSANIALWGGWKKEKESARGTMGRGKREERPLPYNVRFSGQICGSLIMAEPGEDLRDFECSFKDLSLEG